MRLSHLPGGPHLSYCTNIHAGETWSEIRASLEAHLPNIKARVRPQGLMGLGLRLSAIAAEALEEPAALEEFRSFLSRHGVYVFTINAFPFGPFHGRRVKEGVYQPDWLTPERLLFTDRVARVLAALLPPETVGSISTVPGTFKAIASRPGVREAIAENIARHAATLVGILERTGCEIVTALEPEPCCLLETVEETVAFFHDHLWTDRNAALLARLAGLDEASAREAMRRHVGVCYDVCHGAVAFEEPAAAFRAFEQAGIRLAKVQLSSALRLPDVDRETVQKLSCFDDGVYLHQVVRKRNGTLTRFPDLGPAVAALEHGEADGEWRVHCHVPVFLERAEPFHSTQPALKDALARVRTSFVAPHLEVETYTWDVLPKELRAGDRADAIVRELQWVMGELT